jgi:hypothetical protein
MKRCALYLFCLASVLRADSFTFDLLPTGGSISGTAGSVIGWGYSITNESTADWLVISHLNSDPFVDATPNVLFDFPILAPGATATASYDHVLGTGLMELALDGSLSTEVINSGNFVLDAEWWSGDPFGNGILLSQANPVSQPYQAVADPAVVPEPGTVSLLATSGLCLFGFKRAFRSKIYLMKGEQTINAGVITKKICQCP